ncbi:MAG: NAD(P)H-hydrate epimerase [Thermoguttaceae bacterium]|jgi:hydroxyethylthiazole kinase-like uncharacterized protein yjeF
MIRFSPDSDLFSCAEVRDFDRRAIEDYKIPGLLLMENAGRVLAETLIDAIPGAENPCPVLILAGPGNNGGDGFVMARHLQRLRYPVDIVAIGRPGSWKEDAAVNLTILEQLADEHLTITYFDKEDFPSSAEKLRFSLSRAHVVVDAILGTGARGSPRAPIGDIIEIVNSAGKNVFAVDIPSGLDGDTGLVSGVAVRAQSTCTLAAFKKGFANEYAWDYTGNILLGDIGIAVTKLSQQ